MENEHELWKDVVGFEATHMVSSHGRVRTKGRYLLNNGTKIWKPERIVKPYKTNVGYMQINLNTNGKQHKKYVHRLVAEAFLENPTRLPEVDHIDRNKTNNYLNNLRWIDHKSNMQRIQRLKKVTKQKGISRRSANKPPRDHLLSLLQAYGGNFTAVARLYSVTDNAVRKWCRNYGLKCHTKDYKMGA